MIKLRKPFTEEQFCLTSIAGKRKTAGGRRWRWCNEKHGHRVVIARMRLVRTKLLVAIFKVGRLPGIASRLVPHGLRSHDKKATTLLGTKVDLYTPPKGGGEISVNV
jgi:hypothetical protein